MTHKFKKGDKVVILPFKELLRLSSSIKITDEEDYYFRHKDGLHFVKSMKPYCGKTYVIDYHSEEDASYGLIRADFSWHRDWLKKLIPKKPKNVSWEKFIMRE